MSERVALPRLGRPALLALAWLVALAPSGARAQPPAALADSVDVALDRGDMGAALGFAQRLHRLAPGDATALYRLSVSLHDYAVGASTWGGGARTRLRLSLDRIACERRALRLADSAATRAADAPQWARAMFWRAQVMEYLGMPVEAYRTYVLIGRRVAGVPIAAAHADWMAAHLRDPASSDTIRIARHPARP